MTNSELSVILLPGHLDAEYIRPKPPCPIGSPISHEFLNISFTMKPLLNFSGNT